MLVIVLYGDPSRQLALLVAVWSMCTCNCTMNPRHLAVDMHITVRAVSKDELLQVQKL